MACNKFPVGRNLRNVSLNILVFNLTDQVLCPDYMAFCSKIYLRLYDNAPNDAIIFGTPRFVINSKIYKV